MRGAPVGVDGARAAPRGRPVPDHVGGRISPEMGAPKLLWLSRHLPASSSRAALVPDLADLLTWKVARSLARSVRTVTR